MVDLAGRSGSVFELLSCRSLFFFFNFFLSPVPYTPSAYITGHKYISLII